MPSDYSQSLHGPMERVMNMKTIVCSQTSSKFIVSYITSYRPRYIVRGWCSGLSNRVNITYVLCVSCVSLLCPYLVSFLSLFSVIIS